MYIKLVLLLCNLLMTLPIANAQDIEILRAEARQVLRVRLCGVCHIPPGNENALKVFDLDKENWFATISDNRLLQFKWRIRVKGDEIKEQRGDPKKHTFMAAEIDLINEYVDAELKNRSPIQQLFGPMQGK